MRNQKLVKKQASAKLPTKWGYFIIYAYQEILTNKEHVALVMGKILADKPTLVRVHSKCLTGDVFCSLRCDCCGQLRAALKLIAKRGRGVLVYLNQEGRGIGLIDKIKSYQLQDHGLDTVEANIKLGYKPDMRTYDVGAQILQDLGVGKIELMTNNPQKIKGIGQYGLEIERRVPLVIPANHHNKKYLSVKRDKMGHLLH
jgi:3,4-dihydroxy 2-butanone 4-phosphate synthase/GTP cyclohydrolase II